MKWTIPGTVLEIDRDDAASVSGLFHTMFLAGDMALNQVTGISGLETHMVQNWVKRGYLAPPRGKRYSINQLCRILTINMLRGALPMEQICGLLTHINGALDDESDDLIDDSQLYFMFVKLAGRANSAMTDFNDAVDSVLIDYQERAPGAKDRIRRVLHVMLTAWIASRMKQKAEEMMGELLQEP